MNDSRVKYISIGWGGQWNPARRWDIMTRIEQAGALMLERTVHANGVVTYQSPVLRALGVLHAFSTRIGGISAGPFASLNLGNPSEGEQDARENILENYRRLHAAIGCDDVPRAWVRQVHGRRVELLEREPEGEYAETLEAELLDRWSGQLSADGIVANVPGVLLSIRVADCVPILLASVDGRVVAALHAGWRGVAGDIAAKGVKVMREAGAEGEIVAAIGPGISAAHFEVGEEVAAEFQRQGLAEVVLPPREGRAKPHVDLQRAIRLRLEHAGITRIDSNDLCTFRDAAEFYSHRRDRGVTGRMAALIGAAV